jgi:hypothetical protein
MFDSHRQMTSSDEPQFLVTIGRRRDRYETSAGFATELFLSEVVSHGRFIQWDPLVGEKKVS